MPVVEYAAIAGTEAALGRARGHTLVVDRPEGRAGGMGLGFNGGELLALAIGGCLANDLRYAAHAMGVGLGDLRISVDLDIDGEPMRAKSAAIAVALTTTDGSDPQAVIDRAAAACTVSHSLIAGFPVTVRTE